MREFDYSSFNAAAALHQILTSPLTGQEIVDLVMVATYSTVNVNRKRLSDKAKVAIARYKVVAGLGTKFPTLSQFSVCFAVLVNHLARKRGVSPWGPDFDQDDHDGQTSLMRCYNEKALARYCADAPARRSRVISAGNTEKMLTGKQICATALSSGSHKVVHDAVAKVLGLKIKVGANGKVYTVVDTSDEKSTPGAPSDSSKKPTATVASVNRSTSSDNKGLNGMGSLDGFSFPTKLHFRCF
eukprot:GHVH01013921.1.p1 GENE.GHVH01013921.1~~GHVH01013921.1.p1  ORF type:complete len:242 (+),score=21.56 GHVH01013921.1:109-834(+)